MKKNAHFTELSRIFASENNIFVEQFMPKRVISIISVVLAVTVLVGMHSVPHHHHGEVVCFLPVCDDDGHSDCGENCTHQHHHHHHHHPGMPGEGGCLIEASYLFSFEHNELKFKDAGQYDLNPYAQLVSQSFLAATITCLCENIIVCVDKEFRDWYACLYQSVNLSRVNGLRAPPPLWFEV